MPYLTLISTTTQEKYNQAVQSGNSGTFLSETIENGLNKGDLFLFVNGLHYAGEEEAPEGFPLGIDLSSTPVKIDEIRRAEVRSEIRDDGTIDMSFKEPEENIYTSDLNDEVLSAITKCVKGEELVEIDLTSFFDFNS